MNADDKTRLDHIEQKLDDIKDNHLTHIYKALGECMGTLKVLCPLSIGVAVGVVLLVIGMVIQFLA